MAMEEERNQIESKSNAEANNRGKYSKHHRESSVSCRCITCVFLDIFLLARILVLVRLTINRRGNAHR